VGRPGIRLGRRRSPATQRAIRGLTRTAAREWARHGITVNVITPAAKTDAAANIERTNPDVIATIPMVLSWLHRRAPGRRHSR
jgi:NAD(P)-dependent dehydrogenase (short-subunit alcohol dehydrogenase family)